MNFFHYNLNSFKMKIKFNYSPFLFMFKHFSKIFTNLKTSLKVLYNAIGANLKTFGYRKSHFINLFCKTN